MTTPFDPTRCGVPPVSPIDSVDGIEDCFISPAPKPIKDCQKPILPPLDSVLNNPPEFNPINIDPPVPVLPPVIIIDPPPPWPIPNIPWLKFPIFRLQSCDGKEIVYTFQAIFVFFLRKTIKYKGKCWRVWVEEYRGQQPIVQIAKISVYKDCDECGTCWNVYRCSDGTETVVQANLGEVFKKGRIVRFDFDPNECYVPTKKVPCKGDFKKGTVIGIYDSCQYCVHAYELTNCNDPTDKIYTHQPLAYYLNVTPQFLLWNKVVFVHNGFCYYPTRYEFAVQGVEYISIDYNEHFFGCDKCKGRCVKLYPCSSGSSIYASSARIVHTGAVVDLHAMKGQVVQLDNYKCYVVGNSVDCEKYNATSVNVIGLQASCADCICYQLIRCVDGYSFVSCGDTGKRLQIGKIYIAESGNLGGECYEVTGYVDPDVANPENLIYNVSDSVFSTCDECAQQVSGAYKFKLHPICFAEDCDETPVISPVVTEEPLGMFVGGYISFDGICWYVEAVSPSEVTTRKSLLYEGPFDSCEDCLENSKLSPSRYVEEVCHDDSGNPDYVERIMYVPVDPCGRKNKISNPPCDGGGGSGGSGSYGAVKNCETGEVRTWEFGCAVGKAYFIANDCWECIGSSSNTPDLVGGNLSDSYTNCCECLEIEKLNFCIFECTDTGGGYKWVKTQSCIGIDCNCQVNIEGTDCTPGEKGKTYPCG